MIFSFKPDVHGIVHWVGWLPGYQKATYHKIIGDHVSSICFWIQSFSLYYISIWQLLSAFYFRPNIEKVMINKTVR